MCITNGIIIFSVEQVTFGQTGLFFILLENLELKKLKLERRN